MESSAFKAGIAAAIHNGDRLVEDAKLLLEWGSVPTSYALAVLAQEEYAKALILSLVDAGALPWSPGVRRALQDHVCKQLASLILDYLSPDVEEFLRRYDPAAGAQSDEIFPPDVLNAINLICHERIPRERDRWWVGPDDEPLDDNVSAIADGRLDRKKQDAIYVRIGRTGAAISEPGGVHAESASFEVERSERIGRQLRPYGGTPGLRDDLDSEKLIGLFGLLTGRISREDFGAYWWVR